MALRLVELYCGIGGCSAALAPSLARSPEAVEVALAVDINPNALAVYGANFPSHPRRAAAVESLSAATLADLDADLWWMSPPCQPFTRRGKGRDADDPRAATFLALIDRLAEVRPPWLALENVPGFEGSRVHARLLSTLERVGYHAVVERVLCPSTLGLPNRRRRYYLVASHRELGPFEPLAVSPRTVADCLDEAVDPRTRVDEALVQRYERALHRVRAEDSAAVTSCFTSAYGRSPVRSGSYLELGDRRLRRFAPTEILRLLGFPEGFELPVDLAPERLWPLVGNSLSLPAVRSMLGAIPPLAELLREKAAA